MKPSMVPRYGHLKSKESSCVCSLVSDRCLGAIALAFCECLRRSTGGTTVGTLSDLIALITLYIVLRNSTPMLQAQRINVNTVMSA